MTAVLLKIWCDDGSAVIAIWTLFIHLFYFSGLAWTLVYIAHIINSFWRITGGPCVKELAG